MTKILSFGNKILRINGSVLSRPVETISVWDGVTFDTSWQNNTTVDDDGYTVAHITTAEQAVTLWCDSVVHNWLDGISNKKGKVLLDTSVQFNANPDNWINHVGDSWQYNCWTHNSGIFVLDGQFNSVIGLFCQGPSIDNRGCFFTLEGTGDTVKNIRFHKCSSSITSGNARTNILWVSGGSYHQIYLENVIFDQLYLYNRGSSYCQIGINTFVDGYQKISANNMVFSNVIVDVTRSSIGSGAYSILGGSATNWIFSLTQYLDADNIIFHNCSASTQTVYLIGAKNGAKPPTADEFKVTNLEYLDNSGLTANYGTEASNLSSMVTDYNAIADHDINSSGDNFTR